MRYESPCIFCGAVLELLLDGLSDLYKGIAVEKSSIVRCSSCGIGQTIPFLNERQLADLYRSDYAPFTPESGLIQYLRKLKYRLDIRLIQKCVKTKLNSSCNVYEIGAGSGEFLNTFKKFNCTVSGTEPGQAGRLNALNSFNIVLDDFLAEHLVFRNKQDVLIMRHVLEHLSDPRDVLENIYKNGLKTDGVLFLKIPRFDSDEFQEFESDWSGLDIPRHRFHFSKDGLLRLLTSIGYSEIYFRNETAPNDYLRSIKFQSEKIGFNLSLLKKILLRMPVPLSLIFSQLLKFFSAHETPGRMIVIASK